MVFKWLKKKSSKSKLKSDQVSNQESSPQQPTPCAYTTRSSPTITPSTTQPLPSYPSHQGIPLNNPPPLQSHRQSAMFPPQVSSLFYSLPRDSSTTDHSNTTTKQFTHQPIRKDSVLSQASHSSASIPLNDIPRTEPPKRKTIYIAPGTNSSSDSCLPIVDPSTAANPSHDQNRIDSAHAHRGSYSSLSNPSHDHNRIDSAHVHRGSYSSLSNPSHDGVQRVYYAHPVASQPALVSPAYYYYYPVQPSSHTISTGYPHYPAPASHYAHHHS